MSEREQTTGKREGKGLESERRRRKNREGRETVNLTPSLSIAYFQGRKGEILE